MVEVINQDLLTGVLKRQRNERIRENKEKMSQQSSDNRHSAAVEIFPFLELSKDFQESKINKILLLL